MSPIIPGVVASSDGRQPGAPTIGTATPGNTQATIVFTAPAYLGKPNTNNIYTATSSPGGLTGTNTVSPITVSGLINGTAYTFTVNLRTRDSVNNVISTSLSSGASNSVTPFVPGPSFPSFTIPSFPSFSVPSFPSFSVPSFPSFSVPSFPSFPSFSVPSFPSFPSFTIPSFPSFTIPSFPSFTIPSFPSFVPACDCSTQGCSPSCCNTCGGLWTGSECIGC